MNQKEIILDHLQAMGFEIDELGDSGYVFNYEDVNYVYIPEEEDQQFLRIVIPNMFDVTDENRDAVLEASNEVSVRLKYAKVSIMHETSVWAVYEHYLHTTENLYELLEHIIQSLAATAQFFHQSIEGEEVVPRFWEGDDELNDALEAELQSVLKEIEENEMSN